MKIFLILMTISCSAYASTFQSVFQSEIARIELGTKSQEPHLIYLMKDGQVGQVQFEQKALLQKLQTGMKNNQPFEFTLTKDYVITEAKALPAPKKQEAEKLTFTNSTYAPTVLPSMSEATQIFNELNPYYRNRSQCYNRAHVWSYEENQKRGLNSMKVFLFFTAKYMRDYNFHWWFHVSPFVLVNVNGTTEEKVIDYAFMEKPTDMKPWTDYFMAPKSGCPTVNKYSDYQKHQYDQYCYLIKTSQYFWQPSDVEALELTGKEKTTFIPGEVNSAYRQGF